MNCNFFFLVTQRKKELKNYSSSFKEFLTGEILYGIVASLMDRDTRVGEKTEMMYILNGSVGPRPNSLGNNYRTIEYFTFVYVQPTRDCFDTIQLYIRTCVMFYLNSIPGDP